MKVIIENIKTGKKYTCSKESDAKDRVDKSLYREVVSFQTCISMGVMVGYIKK